MSCIVKDCIAGRKYPSGKHTCCTADETQHRLCFREHEKEERLLYRFVYY